MNTLSSIISSATATTTAYLTGTLKSNLGGFTNIVQSLFSEIIADPQLSSLQFQVLAVLTIVNLTCFLASCYIFMINRYKQSPDPDSDCDDGTGENEIDLKLITETSSDAKPTDEHEPPECTCTALIKYVNKNINRPSVNNELLVLTPPCLYLYMTSQMKMVLNNFSSQSISKKIVLDPVWIIEQMKQVHIQTRIIKNNKNMKDRRSTKVIGLILPKPVTEGSLDFRPQKSSDHLKNQLLLTNFAHNERSKVFVDEEAQKKRARAVLMLLIVTGLF